MVLLFVKPFLLLCEHWLLHIESMFFLFESIIILICISVLDIGS